MRNLKWLQIGLVLSALVLTACGGGGGGSSNSGPTTANVQGTWSGSYSINGGPSNVAVTAAIVQGGYGFFYDSTGTVYVLPSLSGSTTLSGTLTAYAPHGMTFPNGQTQEQFSVTGTASSTSISGTFSGNGETGSFSLSPFTPFSGTPSIVAGQWQGYYAGSGGAISVTGTVTSNGSFTGNDALGCALSGTITQVASVDLFTITLTSTGAGCAGSLTGVGYESSADSFGLFGGAPGQYFYAGVSNGSQAFVAEFKM